MYPNKQMWMPLQKIATIRYKNAQMFSWARKNMRLCRAKAFPDCLSIFDLNLIFSV